MLAVIQSPFLFWGFFLVFLNGSLLSNSALAGCRHSKRRPVQHTLPSFRPPSPPAYRPPIHQSLESIRLLYRSFGERNLDQFSRTERVRLVSGFVTDVLRASLRAGEEAFPLLQDYWQQEQQEMLRFVYLGIFSVVSFQSPELEMGQVLVESGFLPQEVTWLRRFSQSYWAAFRFRAEPQSIEAVQAMTNFDLELGSVSLLVGAEAIQGGVEDDPQSEQLLEEQTEITRILFEGV